MNQSIHTVDLVQWMFGPIARVSAAVSTRVHKIDVEDTAAAVIEFASGIEFVRAQRKLMSDEKLAGGSGCHAYFEKGRRTVR